MTNIPQPTLPVSTFQIIGTKGDLRMDSAYSYTGELKQQLTIDDQTQERSLKAGDQFAAEIVYFSECVLMGKDPEPSGVEGSSDIRIIRAIYQSAQTGKPVQLGEFKRQQRPTAEQITQRPAIDELPEMINAADPSSKS